MSPAPLHFHGGKVTLHAGDCLDVLATLPPNSVDSIVTDPPYHLTSIVKRFGAKNSAPAKDYSGERDGATGAYARASRGFMGKVWDGGDIAFSPETWAAMMRVLKPGGHLAAFAAAKNAHRMVCSIEDAGFEIRDTLMWLYRSGFPKSLNVSKAIDKMAGAEFPAPEDAARWQGFGTALKPAYEPICLARKPIDGTVAANVLAHGVGALNIDGCRIEASDNTTKAWRGAGDRPRDQYRTSTSGKTVPSGLGRWPANVLHDGSDEVVAAFPVTAASSPPRVTKRSPDSGRRATCGTFAGQDGVIIGRGDSGSPARFFYSAKADAADRLGSKHPTVKPLDLMCWLVRLVTPQGGVLLDPFAGTGSTGEAALREGMRAVLIEREPEYRADIASRMAHVTSSPSRRRAEKLVVAGEVVDAGPLFAGGIG